MIRVRTLAILITATLALTLALGVGSAIASKQVIDYFGTASGTGSGGGDFNSPSGVAVNSSGAGPASRGDIYVVDVGLARIQRFGHDDNGTPAEPKDDSYFFISAWGAGVKSGGNDYQICEVAIECQPGSQSGGNGTVAGDGTLTRPLSLAVDQDTGNVYISDQYDRRINVYSGDGQFQRSYGWDVVASGAGNEGLGYEVCIASRGDVCKAGLAGSGVGQIGETALNWSTGRGIAVSPPDGNSDAGTIFLADPANHRVDTFNLDGSEPSSFGTTAIFRAGGSGNDQPKAVAVDSRGIVYATNEVVSSVGPNIQHVERYDSRNVNGDGVGFMAPIFPKGSPRSLAVDPDSDGAGPDSDLLYVGSGEVWQYGPLNEPGLTMPPAGVDASHGTSPPVGEVTAMATDEFDGRIYVPLTGAGGQRATGVYVLGDPIGGGAPTVSLESLSDLTAHSVVMHGIVNPNGRPSTGYYLEYSTDGTTWVSTPEIPLGIQETPQVIEATLDPPLGLAASTFYHVRLTAHKRFLEPVHSSELTFITQGVSPTVETTGSPVRSMETARLDARVNPENAATTYYFEYGDEGPCDSNPCIATESQFVGSGSEVKLVSQSLTELEPGTTYYYRVVAENGDSAGPSFGQDRTLTTFNDGAPLSHGALPGPPGSDRVWEQVNAPDTGGNPVSGASAIGVSGERVLYTIEGGSPDSESGTVGTPLFAERTAGGWQTKRIFPSRDDAGEAGWVTGPGSPDLAMQVTANVPVNEAGEVSVWRQSPTSQPALILRVPKAQWRGFLVVSDDASRVVVGLEGSQDLDYPMGSGEKNLYDLSSGSPKLVGLMPNGTVPSCGVGDSMPSPLDPSSYTAHWISADGSLLFFETKGNNCSSGDQLYVRELGTEQTSRISQPPISGPQCEAFLVKSTPDAAFFVTKSRLTSNDTTPEGCGGSNEDIYRYDFVDHALKCITCVTPGLNANVSRNTAFPNRQIGVADNGARVYFESGSRLLPGAPQGGGTYRVDVASGDIAFVATLAGNRIGDGLADGTTMTPDGSVVIFRASAPGLNGIGGQQNGGTAQFYRYDDRDRSLVCISCPADGSLPTESAEGELGRPGAGPNRAISDDGDDVAFATPTPLVSADQNTPDSGQSARAGTDVYEWRDGRVLLVSDGLSNWPSGEGGNAQVPQVRGISPSGRDIFFTAAAQYTPDALDAYKRLYDARIGGGFEFPVPPKPCPLEVCQGTPNGAPEERSPGTQFLQGAESTTPKAKKKKATTKKKGKATHRKKHTRKSHRKASNNRRAER